MEAKSSVTYSSIRFGPLGSGTGDNNGWWGLPRWQLERLPCRLPGLHLQGVRSQLRGSVLFFSCGVIAALFLRMQCSCIDILLLFWWNIIRSMLAARWSTFLSF